MTFLASLAIGAAVTWIFLSIAQEFPIVVDLIAVAILIGAICYVW